MTSIAASRGLGLGCGRVATQIGGEDRGVVGPRRPCCAREGPEVAERRVRLPHLDVRGALRKRCRRVRGEVVHVVEHEGDVRHAFPHRLDEGHEGVGEVDSLAVAPAGELGPPILVEMEALDGTVGDHPLKFDGDSARASAHARDRAARGSRRRADRASRLDPGSGHRTNRAASSCPTAYTAEYPSGLTPARRERAAHVVDHVHVPRLTERVLIVARGRHKGRVPVAPSRRAGRR